MLRIVRKSPVCSVHFRTFLTPHRQSIRTYELRSVKFDTSNWSLPGSNDGELVDSQLQGKEFFLECRLFPSRPYCEQKANNTLPYRYTHCFSNLLHACEERYRGWIVPGKAFVTPPEIRGARIQQHSLRQIEFDPQKLWRKRQNCRSLMKHERNQLWEATICYQLNYRRPHLFEKFPCS